MKRLLSIMLSMALCLPMVACEPAPAEPVDPPVDQDPPPPPYAFVVENTADKYSDTDGTMLAAYGYDILRMKTSETASEEDIARAAAFNETMDTVLENQLGSELREWAVDDERIKETREYYTDELKVTYAEMGGFVSICYDSYSYTGGAHPNARCFSYLFDMDRGVFVDATEIADDPELLRATVTDLILDQINGMDQEIRDGLFENYPSVVSQWNDRCVVLGEDGMTVTFSAYDIGPYAMGALSVEIPYASITTALGEGGAEKLLGTPSRQ